ncbi:MAG: hypothetical protein HY782_09620 [Chloroflexi bacterium]|nr:hypothetical protein [Chloroflexota bacterium]
MTDSQQTTQELVSEGRKLLDSGDKPRALAHFITASQLDPFDESVWLLRAQASDDPAEVSECLAQVLEINPANAQARARLLDSRVNQLQSGAIERTTGLRAAAQSKLEAPRVAFSGCLAGIFLSILGLGLLLGLGLIALVIFAQSEPDQAYASLEANAEPTLALQLPPTWTPSPTSAPSPTPTATPTPLWKAARSVSVRSGPGAQFAALGTLASGAMVHVAGRTADNKYLAIQYPDSSNLGWVPGDQLAVANGDPAAVPIITALPVLPATPRPTVKPTLKPAATPVPQYDFVLGRPVELIADCSRPWKVMGTVYASAQGAQRLSGVMVRVTVAGQTQGITTSGSVEQNKPGYWEWSFNRGAEVVGSITIVNPDGTSRSAAIPFHLTWQCDTAGAANAAVIDMVKR